MGKAEPMSAEKKRHLADMRKAHRLRKRLAEGKGDAEEIRAQLAALPAPKQARTRAAMLDDATEKGEVEGAATPAPSAAETPPGDSQPGDLPPRRPPPEAPPAVEVLPRTAGGDWRAKYRQAIGREGVCLQVGELYCVLLKRLSAYVESTGARPVLPAAEIDALIRPAAILTADRLLPRDFEVTPEVELCALSGIVVGQAAITASRQKRAGRAAAGRRDPVSAPPPRRPDPAPEPEKSEAAHGSNGVPPTVDQVPPDASDTGAILKWPKNVPVV